MSDKIRQEDLENFTAEVIVHSSKIPGMEKSISYKIETIITGIGIQFRTNFHVKDRLNKIVHAGDHLSVAIRAYNKLYN